MGLREGPPNGVAEAEPKGGGSLPGGNMRMAWGDEWTGREWVRCTELRLWLGMLLLPPGLANHRFCIGHGKREKW